MSSYWAQFFWNVVILMSPINIQKAFYKICLTYLILLILVQNSTYNFLLLNFYLTLIKLPAISTTSQANYYPLFGSVACRMATTFCLQESVGWCSACSEIWSTPSCGNSSRWWNIFGVYRWGYLQMCTSTTEIESHVMRFSVSVTILIHVESEFHN